MTVQKIKINVLSADIIDMLKNKERVWKAIALAMTLDPYGNVFDSTIGCTLYFPRRFSKKFLARNRKVNYCPLPFVAVQIKSTTDSPSYYHIQEWKVVKDVLDLLLVDADRIPTTVISGEHFKTPTL